MKPVQLKLAHFHSRSNGICALTEQWGYQRCDFVLCSASGQIKQSKHINTEKVVGDKNN